MLRDGMIDGVRIDAVLFDMDGVLIDAQETHRKALRHALDDFHYAITPAQERLLEALPTRVKLNKLGIDPNVAVHLELRKQAYTKEYAGQYPLDSVRVNRVTALGWRTKVGVVTNSRAETAKLFLSRAGFAPFDVLVTNEDAKPKPSPDGYLLACRTLGVIPENVLVFEDSPVGMAAAQAAGTQAVQVTFDTLLNHPFMRFF